jgi:ectoine hydroxylase-related dioxygenase (phytanoyl-CoA dioxygenase family)
MSATTAADVAHFRREGYLVARGLFSSAEAALLRAVARADPLSQALNEATGKRSKIFFPPDHEAHDVYNAVCRCQRMVSTLEALMSAEVAIYHKKVIMKDDSSFFEEPEGREGGKISNAWAWHQDYGYWYSDTDRLNAELISCAVAIDPAHRGNGCLEVMPTSHRLGRLDHASVDGQVNSHDGAV